MKGGMYFPTLAACLGLLVGPRTFQRWDPSLTNRTRRAFDPISWSEVWAAEPAGQMATWLVIDSSDFPSLGWDLLATNVLAHYTQSLGCTSSSCGVITLNTYFRDMYFNEPHVLQMVIIHELLHAFEFGFPANATQRALRWTLEFDTASPGVTNYHWDTSATGYHRRTRLPADSEVMQPVLGAMSHLTMASLVASGKALRYACETGDDCNAMRRYCVHSSDSWVGTCSFEDPSSSTRHSTVVLGVVTTSIALGAVVLVLVA